MSNKNNLQGTKKSTKQLSDSRSLNSSNSNSIPKGTSRLNIQSTGNDFYTGISNDDMSSISNINNTTGDSLPQVPAVNKGSTKK